jgi:hypothetical protein
MFAGNVVLFAIGFFIALLFAFKGMITAKGRRAEAKKGYRTHPYLVWTIVMLIPAAIVFWAAANTHSTLLQQHLNSYLLVTGYFIGLPAVYIRVRIVQRLIRKQVVTL